MLTSLNNWSMDHLIFHPFNDFTDIYLSENHTIDELGPRVEEGGADYISPTRICHLIALAFVSDTFISKSIQAKTTNLVAEHLLAITPRFQPGTKSDLT